jgi:predicted nucleic acid-binding Zn ribbon protein
VTPKDNAPKKIRETLAKYLEKSGIAEHIDAASVVPEWPTLVGPAIASVTTPLRVSAGTLVVGVRSSAWMNELKLMEREIVRRLNADRLKKRVDSIRFVMSE